MFDLGEYVVYSASEICEVGEKVKRCFDGVNSNEYFKLIPIASSQSSYYVPIDGAEEKVRKLLSKEQIYEIIDNIPNIEENWFEDKNERKNYFKTVLKSDDYSQIISMIKSIYSERKRRNSTGKNLIASDEKAFMVAERLMHQEFAVVLGIKEEEVVELIESRIGVKEDLQMPI